MLVQLTIPRMKAADAGQPSSPVHPEVHLFDDGPSAFVLVVNGSRIYRLEASDRWRLALRMQSGDRVQELLAELGLDAPPAVDDTPLSEPPLRALSLAVAQKCNLGCIYCYAQEGSFGGEAKQMPLERALVAVDTLFAEAAPGERLNLSFLGGEPLYARDVIYAATKKAAALGKSRGIAVGFSITTNGTLLNHDDAEFFERFGFAVTISLDGLAETHDRLRPFKGGQSSFTRILDRVRPLLAQQHRMQASARVTVTPQNLQLRRTLDELLDLGFHSVGFSPMLSAPTGRGEMGSGELMAMLDQMIDCGREFERKCEAGERYAFSNMVTALNEIHRGTHRPYPCGAGAGYMAVSADGGFAACHRFVNDDSGYMGDLISGIDRERQNRWLAMRHVHRQEPCRSCWARYMCGGGCHHEVIHRGRPACGYIRGWLHYCLQAYSRLLERCPEYLDISKSRCRDGT
jgi:uncharacterized protein